MEEGLTTLMSESARIAIIAGDGRLPVEAMRRLHQMGRPVTVVAVGQEPEPELEQMAAAYLHIPVYEWARALQFLAHAQVNTVYLVGKVKKGVVFFSVPDEEARAALDSLPERSDEALLQAVVQRLAQAGVTVRPQAELLDHLVVGSGLLTSTEPRRPDDVALGVKVARSLAHLGIGQTVVVKDGVVVAVEAAEGTDATIRRGGTVAGPGVTVVKMAQTDKDGRFDIPVVGLRTLEQMAAVGAQTLALEAGRAFIVDRDDVVAKATEAGIAIWGIAAGEGENPAVREAEGPGPERP